MSAAHDVAGIIATWGEPATYIPKGGESKPIRAVIDRSIRTDQSQFGIFRNRVAKVFVAKTSDDGIETAPEIGSSLILSDSPPGEAYSCDSTPIEEDSESLTVEFVLRDPKYRGGNYVKQ